MDIKTERFIRISIDILNKMRNIKIIGGKLNLSEDVEVVFEKVVTPFGNSAKVDSQKKYIGKRAYVIIMKD
jgi:putative transposon-encoded protein